MSHQPPIPFLKLQLSLINISDVKLRNERFPYWIWEEFPSSNGWQIPLLKMVDFEPLGALSCPRSSVPHLAWLMRLQQLRRKPSTWHSGDVIVLPDGLSQKAFSTSGSIFLSQIACSWFGLADAIAVIAQKTFNMAFGRSDRPDV